VVAAADQEVEQPAPHFRRNGGLGLRCPGHVPRDLVEALSSIGTRKIVVSYR
jgi:hypothetical protein